MQLFFEFETRRAKHGVFPYARISGADKRQKVAAYLYSAAKLSASLFISSPLVARENKITR